MGCFVNANPFTVLSFISGVICITRYQHNDLNTGNYWVTPIALRDAYTVRAVVVSPRGAPDYIDGLSAAAFAANAIIIDDQP